MMPLDAIRILKTTEETRWNDDTTATKLYVVKFMVGASGPFAERFPQADFTAQKRDLRLQEIGREIWHDPPPA